MRKIIVDSLYQKKVLTAVIISKKKNGKYHVHLLAGKDLSKPPSVDIEKTDFGSLEEAIKEGENLMKFSRERYKME